ncbi:MAG: hypothetical protein ACR2RB_06865 [Gammaproteobacteria bacterium]
MVKPRPPRRHAFIGAWRRVSIREGRRKPDTTTRVYWLQTSRYYADIRIRAGRPDYTGRTCLADCTLRQLRWLATQQGFAGSLDVDGVICTWHRDIDYQPSPPVPDSGRMEQHGNEFLEYGIYADYVERWRRLAPLDGQRLALSTTIGTGRQRHKAWLIAVGDHFIFARQRASDLPGAPSLSRAARNKDLSREALTAMLDFEISFGVRRAGRGPWQIRLSTLPFREGESLFATSARPTPQGNKVRLEVPAVGSRTRTWAVHEWTKNFRWV